MRIADGTVSQRIQALEDRVAQLQEASYLSPEQSSAALLEELKNSLELLHIQREELEQRYQQLDAAQADLGAGRRRYQELFDQAPDGYAVTDPTGIIQYANLTLSRQLGLPQEDISGKPLVTFFAPGERRSFRHRLNKLEQDQRTSDFETTLQRMDREPLPVLVSVNLARDSQQKVTGIRWLVHDLTQRKLEEAQRARQREEITGHQEVLREISEGIEDFAIFLLDPSGHIITWNRGAHEIKGYEAAEILGKHFSYFYPQEDIQQGKPWRLLELAASGRYVEDEGWRVRKNGQRFWASVLITALRAPGGELRGFAKVVRDLTLRQRAEEDRHVHLAMVAARMGSWEWDIATGVVLWSENLEAIHGLPRGTFGGTIEDVRREIHPEDRERVLEAVNQALQGQDSYNADYRITLPGGSIRWLSARGHVVRDSQGQPVRMLGVCMDVTERKYMEAALQEREERFRTLLEKSYDIVALLSPEGTVTYVSPAITPILGYSVEEFVGRHAFELMHPDDQDRVWAIFADLVQNPGSTRTAEYRYLHKDGSWRWL